MHQILHHLVGPRMPVNSVRGLLLSLELVKSLAKTVLQVLWDVGVGFGNGESDGIERGDQTGALKVSGLVPQLADALERESESGISNGGDAFKQGS